MDMKTLQPIKFCPYCGTSHIRYIDKDFPYYARCEHCDTIMSAMRDLEEWEVLYITQKLKMAQKIYAELEASR